MKIYIAGPMRGLMHYNFPAFDAASEEIRNEGHIPVNPADLDRQHGFDIHALPDDWDWSTLPEGMDSKALFDRDMAALRQCDAIWLLPGWAKSTGALAEYHAAKWLGLQVIDTDLQKRSALDGTAEERKRVPIASGVLGYFPDAIAAIAHCSWVGNEQHNPGEPLHWSRHKSSDHADCMIRHFMQRGTVDGDGVRHTTKAAWRALAMLQLELEDA